MRPLWDRSSHPVAWLERRWVSPWRLTLSCFASAGGRSDAAAATEGTWVEIDRGVGPQGGRSTSGRAKEDRVLPRLQLDEALRLDALRPGSLGYADAPRQHRRPLLVSARADVRYRHQQVLHGSPHTLWNTKAGSTCNGTSVWNTAEPATGKASQRSCPDGCTMAVGRAGAAFGEVTMPAENAR